MKFHLLEPYLKTDDSLNVKKNLVLCLKREKVCHGHAALPAVTYVPWIRAMMTTFPINVHSGGTPTSSTGPSNGRTGSSSDYYIYTEASGKSQNDVAM